MDLQTQFRK